MLSRCSCSCSQCPRQPLTHRPLSPSPSAQTIRPPLSPTPNTHSPLLHPNPPHLGPTAYPSHRLPPAPGPLSHPAHDSTSASTASQTLLPNIPPQDPFIPPTRRYPSDISRARSTAGPKGIHSFAANLPFQGIFPLLTDAKRR